MGSAAIAPAANGIRSYLRVRICLIQVKNDIFEKILRYLHLPDNAKLIER